MIPALESVARTTLLGGAVYVGVTVGLAMYRAVRRYVGPISLDAPSKFGQVSEARAELMRKYGR